MPAIAVVVVERGDAVWIRSVDEEVSGGIVIEVGASARNAALIPSRASLFAARKVVR